MNSVYPNFQSRPATVAITEYLLKNNLNADGSTLTDAVMNDLMEILSTNATSNAVVIPALLTLDALIENGVATLASSTEKGATMYLLMSHWSSVTDCSLV